jgi:UDP-N-acetylglucosamine 1-carboxyvinyltransferase
MRFIIHGGKHLSGKVQISGMKNAATPIIAATLLTKEECVLKNVPRITDVLRLLDILKSLGAKVEWEGEHTVKICCKDVDLKTLDKKLVQTMRSSALLLGPLLARFHNVEMPEPGGCIIGNRPLDTHVLALQALGVKVELGNGAYAFSTKGMQGGEVVLQEFSVTATENVLMASSLTPKKTVIKLAATEPHVQDLCLFLQRLGVKISTLASHTLEIQGTPQLSGACHSIIPDQVEIGTLASLAALTHGEIALSPIVPEHLDIILLKLKNIGVRFSIKDNTLLVQHSPRLLKAFRLQTFPYPGFPTDLQAPFGVLATQCNGTSLIQDPMYEGRLGYISELQKMGANAIIADPHRVIISGPTPLYGTEVKSLDLRAGATMIIAGLVAQGETIINNAEIIDRGYEKIEEKLKGVGADIQRVV